MPTREHRYDMHGARRTVTILALILFLTNSGFTQGGRKLPEGAYLKTAKIEMSYCTSTFDYAHYVFALAMLDSLDMWYGPVPEGLFLKSQITSAFIDHTALPTEKVPLVSNFVQLVDSLKWACNEGSIKERYKENCRTFITQADSMRMAIWQTFHDALIDMIGPLDEIESQSLTPANVESAIVYLQMCILLDPADAPAYDALDWLRQLHIEDTSNAR